jgi:alkanesulfonate monooxygenase SsuD/methylene tetrahydromethanopterin reductase-like flavin-dependent oxidoreductase (luciferase family)
MPDTVTGSNSPRTVDRLRPERMRFSVFSLHDNYASHRSVPRFYDDTLAQAIQAEAFGYDGFFIAEHHFRENGACPNPAVFLTAVASRTRHLRVGTGVSVLPLRDPRTVAEDYMMLDMISGGRCVLGVSSGVYDFEFAGFGMHVSEKQERFDEVLAILRQALRGDVMEFEGKYNRAHGVAINIPPMRQPHLPLYIGGLSAKSAYRIGSQGDNFMNTPFVSVKSPDKIGEILSEYRRGVAERTEPPTGTNTVLLLHCHVGETDAEARATGTGPYELYTSSRLDPRAQNRTYAELRDSGIALFGSVESVTEQVLDLFDMGAGELLLYMNFGAMPHAHVMRSMELFATHVIPRVHARIAERAGVSV